MHPRFQPVYRLWIRFGRLVSSSRFTDADPFKIIYVDPNEIADEVTNVLYTWGRVWGGEWQRNPIASKERWEVLQQRYVEQQTWETIDHQLEDTAVWDTLYESVRKNGYLSQAELAERGQTGSLTWDCEVGVGIDADGSIVWLRRGSHRLRIAKLLEVDEIPVQVRVRHTEWQAIRDEIRAATTVEELSDQARKQLGHPDLQDVERTLSDRQESEHK